MEIVYTIKVHKYYYSYVIDLVWSFIKNNNLPFPKQLKEYFEDMNKRLVILQKMILDAEVPYDEEKVNRIYLNISDGLHKFIMGMFYTIPIDIVKSYYEDLMEAGEKFKEQDYLVGCDISKNVFKLRNEVDSSKIRNFRFLYVEKTEDGEPTNIVFEALLRT